MCMRIEGNILKIVLLDIKVSDGLWLQYMNNNRYQVEMLLLLTLDKCTSEMLAALSMYNIIPFRM